MPPRKRPVRHEKTAAPSVALTAAEARSVHVALLVPDPQVAFTILALNTEKAHSLREKPLEPIHMVRALARRSQAPEVGFAFDFERPAFLTLGVCDEERPRLSGGAAEEE